MTTTVVQLAVVHTPPLQRAFDTTPLDLTQWAICAGSASAVPWVDELRKLAHRH